MLSRLPPREIGRPFGIPVRLDSSWFVFFIAYIWVIAWLYLPALAPGLSRASYLALGLVTNLLFFVSVVGHEMAHSLVARSEGIGIYHITLYVFGGMAHLERDPETPRAEFRIAAAGPAASFTIGCIFLLLEFLGLHSPAHPAVSQMFHHLGWLNVILAAFNLLPGFPLDGGRMLRALLWKRSGSFAQATRQALGVGKLIAYGLLFGGLLLLPTNWAIGLSNCLIGGLLISLLPKFTVPDAQPTDKQPACSNGTASDAIFSPAIAVAPETTVESFMNDTAARHSHSTFPVVSQGRLHGILRVARARALPPEAWAQTRLRDVMEPVNETFFVNRHTSLGDVVALLSTNRLGHAAVLDGDGLVLGYVSLSDVRRVKKD